MFYWKRRDENIHKVQKENPVNEEMQNFQDLLDEMI